jgi:vacuolar protein sorting-associated protein 13A/C
VILFNASNRLATLALSAANVALHLRDGALEVEGQLGNLSLTDDSPLATKSSAFKQILSIEGDDLAKFKYETFKHSDIKDGVSSSVQLRAGSLKFNFLEQPLADIYQFMVKFARLKGLYDAATQAAVQRASEIQRMKFDILVQSPILVFPVGPSESHDVLTMKLGQIVARNEYSGPVGKITAGLQGIRFTSTTHDKDDICELKIIEDVNISSDIIQTSDIDRKVNVDQPDTEVRSFAQTCLFPF